MSTGGIGQGTAEIVRLGLAAEGQAQGLGVIAAAQVEGGVPDGQGADDEDADGRHARAEDVAVDPAEQLDENGAQPEGQRAFLGPGQAGHVGPQPVVQAAMRHGPHDAETGGVIVLPRFAADQARQDVQQAKRKQGPSWQRECGSGGKADWLHR